MWHYTGFGYDIQIDDTFKDACYRTSSFTETGCVGGSSGQRPILLRPGEEWWINTTFWYTSNLPWTAVFYQWLCKTPDPILDPFPPCPGAGGYCGYLLTLPASSTWKVAALSTNHFTWQQSQLPTVPPNTNMDVLREMVLGFYSEEYGLTWDRANMISVWRDGIVFANGAVLPEYRGLTGTFSMRARQ